MIWPARIEAISASRFPAHSCASRFVANVALSRIPFLNISARHPWAYFRNEAIVRDPVREFCVTD